MTFLATSEANRRRTAFAPYLPIPPVVVDPDAIPGRLPLADFFDDGGRLDVGFLHSFYFPAPFACALALPYRGWVPMLAGTTTG